MSLNINDAFSTAKSSQPRFRVEKTTEFPDITGPQFDLDYSDEEECQGAQKMYNAKVKKVRNAAEMARKAEEARKEREKEEKARKEKERRLAEEYEKEQAAEIKLNEL